MCINKGYKKVEMQTKRKYKKKTITKEQLLEIRLENQRKLDEIMNIPNYIEVLAKKYYEDDWMRTLGNSHYLKIEKQKRNAIANVRRQKEENYVPRIASTTLPIVELTLEGEFIKEWDNIKLWRDENPTKHYISPIQCANGKQKVAYGRTWKFKQDYENGK